jgi:plastocyanin
MKSSRVLGVLAALLLPFVTTVAPAQAAGASVTVANMAFSPAKVRVGLGEAVTWTFQDAISHTATSDNGFFDTGAASGGATRTVGFPSAGTFGYHCTFHPMMVGKVSVPMGATGSAKAGWRLRWLAGTNPQGRTYDVQVRRKGSAWTYYRKGTAAASGKFDPGAGSWQARARTVKGAARSGWSPAIQLQ